MERNHVNKVQRAFIKWQSLNKDRWIYFFWFTRTRPVFNSSWISVMLWMHHSVMLWIGGVWCSRTAAARTPAWVTLVQRHSWVSCQCYTHVHSFSLMETSGLTAREAPQVKTLQRAFLETCRISPLDRHYFCFFFPCTKMSCYYLRTTSSAVRFNLPRYGWCYSVR